MSSAFRNFFITFAVCLLIFGFIGLKFAYPRLSEIVDFTDMGDNTSAVSGDDTSETSEGDSDTVITPTDNYNENGDVFTAFIMNVDSQNRVLSSVFIDSNAKSGQFVYCPISPTVKAVNEVGANVPIGDMFSMMTPAAVCQSVTALTGIKTDYCLRFTRSSLTELAKLIPGAYVVLNEDISIVNPKYADYVHIEGTDYPSDYNIIVTNVDGKVRLGDKISGKTKLEWLLSYNPNSDGSEYNALYTKICKALIRQFFEQEGAIKNSEAMAKLVKCCETNLTTDAASEHIETIFSYNDFKVHEVSYPNNWETAVTKLRELDGSYNR